MRVVVDILKADIEKGEQGQADTCAVSRGVERYVRKNYKKFGLKNSKSKFYVSTGENSGVAVDVEDGERYFAEATNTLNRFIDKFDENKKSVKPCRFALNFEEA